MPGSLAHSPADVVRRLLIALGLGTDPATSAAWPVYASGEPDTPDSAITVFDTSGMLHGRSQIDGEVQEHHGVLVKVRAAAHTTGYAKARAIAVGLDAMYQDTLTLGSSRYLVHCVNRTSDVLALGKESPDSKRSLFTLNAVVSLRQVA